MENDALPDLSAMSIYRHWQDQRVRFGDLDPLNHVNNNAIGGYFEDARVALNRAVGLYGAVPGRQVVLVHSRYDFKAEVHLDAALRVGMGLLSLGRTSWTVGAGLFIRDPGGDPSLDRCAATHQAVMVLLDTESRRPVPIPDAMRDRLAPYQI